LRDFLPKTAVHVLTIGRKFCDVGFVRAVAEVRHPDLMLGIPLYSDLPEEHDYIVQAKGAFNETVRGILNLKRKRLRVELRFVIHRETTARMPDFARFVARNLSFVDHVALMGLELAGFARVNLDSLWIDPLDYQRPLREAVRALERLIPVRAAEPRQMVRELHPVHSAIEVGMRLRLPVDLAVDVSADHVHLAGPALALEQQRAPAPPAEAARRGRGGRISDERVSSSDDAELFRPNAAERDERGAVRATAHRTMAMRAPRGGGGDDEPDRAA
jgi:hypothetical protein